MSDESHLDILGVAGEGVLRRRLVPKAEVEHLICNHLDSPPWIETHVGCVVGHIFSSPYASVCDLYCGGGGGGGPNSDYWDDPQIGHYIGIDASSSLINDALDVWESQRKPYTAQLVQADPCAENLESLLRDKGVPVDIVCCMQHLQLCFETEERAKTLLLNVSSMLKPGGYFFGITPDSSTIWAKYQKMVEASHSKGGGLKANLVPNCIRSENYMITFEVEEEKFPLFGKKYQLKFANDFTAESHCLVHFPSLIRQNKNALLAREAGLEFIEMQNLTEFYDDNRALLAGMLLNAGSNFVDPRGRLLPRSFDILGLYTTFIFQKPDPDLAPPLMTPTMDDEYHMQEDEWQENNWGHHMPPTSEEKKIHVEPSMPIDGSVPVVAKGILGPGPAELRFS
ncbi:hypothetical protein Sjap_013604 [Stephania japonica]|uniref:mRNA cap guanine-N(7) methyltransferase 2 n=1 Tax=Stephania japonica TaxID=461633 RepID=A0AAP0IY37_9MAGN